MASARAVPASMSGSAAFSTAGSSGRSCPDWKTKPKSWRRRIVRRASESVVTSSPRHDTEPDDGVMIPARQCRRVVLPDPDGPMMASDSPGCTVRLTPARACVAVWAEP